LRPLQHRFNQQVEIDMNHPKKIGIVPIFSRIARRAALLAMAVIPAFARAADVTAIPVQNFLNSIGINATMPDRGEPLPRTVEMIQYGGFRWVRGGIEGLSENGPTTVQTYLDLHQQTGVVFSWGLGSGGTNLKKLIDTAHQVAAAGAIFAFEGNNEPNNWGITWQGEKGGGHAKSWMAVAKLQNALYEAVKGDPLLQKYPVFSISEGGAERDNVGMQFLTIPDGADTVMPAGTRYADYANVHNYIYHANSPKPTDNKSWDAADPTPACKVDGLFGEFGVTWARHFRGYPQEQLNTLPRVTTETGSTIGDGVDEHEQAVNLVSMYLDQFRRGWSYTSVYILRDRTDEGGNQSFGFFGRDYKPRQAAVYLHNLTTILADTGAATSPQIPAGTLDYTIANEPDTVHDMLLRKSDGTMDLVVWDEQLTGSNDVTVHLNSPHGAVHVYDTTVDTAPKSTAAGSDVQLSVSDHPFIIEVAPK
jgi:hypothetical protein